MTLEEAIKELQTWDSCGCRDCECVSIILSAAEKWAAMEWWESLSDTEQGDMFRVYLAEYESGRERELSVSLYSYRAKEKKE